MEGFEISPRQKQLWTNNGNPLELPVLLALNLKGHLHLPTLKRSLGLLVEHHSVLRTRFLIPPTRKLPLQVIQEKSSFCWEFAPWPEEFQIGVDSLLDLFRRDDGPVGSPLRVKCWQQSEQCFLLVFWVPALCCDGNGLLLLAQHGLRTYENLLQERDTPWEGIQFIQYTQWLEELADDSEAGREFWDERLRAARQEATPRLCGGKNPAKPTSGNELPQQTALPLSSTLSQTIDSFCREREINAEALWLHVWQVLLIRLSHGARVPLWVGRSGRSFEELEKTVGSFSRYLPLGSQAPAGENIVAGALRLERELAQLDEWQHYFGMGPQGQGPHPSFGFSYEEQGFISQGDTLNSKILATYNPEDYFALKLQVLRESKSIRIVFYHQRQVFSRHWASTMLSRLVYLMETGLKNPQRPAKTLPWLTPLEINRWDREWNQSRPGFSGNLGVHQLFEQQARRVPDAAALVFADPTQARERRLSYEALDQSSGELADRLRRRGIGAGRLVAIIMDRSPRLVTALLGTLRSGAAFVVLGRHLPRKRLLENLAEIAPDLVLTQVETEMGPTSPPSICLEERAPRYNGPRRASPEYQGLAPVYGVFTSGSSGKPKLVLVRHGNLANYVQAVNQALGLEENRSFALVSDLSADLGYTTLFHALCHGAALHLIERNRTVDAKSFAAYGRDRRFEALKITPTHLNALMNQGDPKGVLPTKALILGGETAPKSLLERIKRLAPDLRIHNHYGPSETTIGITTTTGGGSREGEQLPLGHALANNRIYVVDPFLERLPPGLAGELVVGGSQLSLGYASRPDLTAERFVPDPFGAETGGRLYRTGDRVRRGEQGLLWFLGRVDRQVKIRGFRVEPGEVEAVFSGCGTVRAMAVTTQAKADGDTALLAYAVPHAEPADRKRFVAELREWAARELPGHMIPTRFVVMETLPLTPSGKTDYQSLPRVDLAVAEDGAGRETPQCNTEEQLLSIWREALELKEIGTRDHFFSLGGHSLNGTIALARVNRDFGVNLMLPDLFKAPTIETLARLILLGKLGSPEGHRAAETAVQGEIGNPQYLSNAQLEQLVMETRPDQPQNHELIRQPRNGTAPLFPLSFAQRRLWAIQKSDPAQATYNVPIALNISGSLDCAALETTATAMAARHEVLRTSFTLVDHQPFQKVEAADERALPVVDLSALPAALKIASGESLARAFAAKPFQMEREFLIRYLLLRLETKAAENHLFVINKHHLVSDAWSVAVFIADMGRFYRAATRCDGVADQKWQPPRLQYADFAVWERSWMSSPAFEKGLAYWVDRLKNLPKTTALPYDCPPTAATPPTAQSKFMRLPKALARAVNNLARERETTLFMVLLAAFKSLLFCRGGGPDQVVGTDIANRRFPELNGLIGFFINQLVLRTDLGGDPNFLEILGRVKETTLKAYEFGDIPYDKLVEALGGRRSSHLASFFQVKIMLHNTPQRQLNLPGLAFEARPMAITATKLDLQLNLWEADDSIEGEMIFKTGIFQPATVSGLLRQLETVLEQVTAAPKIRLTALKANLKQADRRHRQEKLRQHRGKGFRRQEPTPPEPPTARPQETVEDIFNPFMTNK